MLPRAIQVMQWPYSMAQGIGVGNRRRDVGLGKKNRLWQPAAMCKMTCQGGGEGTSGAVGGIRALAVGLENFSFYAPRGGEAEEVDGSIEVPSRYYDVGRSQRV
jgi:hypothetical protein